MSRKSRIETNFLEKQARENASAGPGRGIIFGLLLLFIGGIAFGAYTVFTNLTANPYVRNVSTVLKSPALSGGKAVVTVEVQNFNAIDVGDPVFTYSIEGGGNTVIASGKVELKGTIPAADVRSFEQVTLGAVEGQPRRMHADLVDLKATAEKKLPPGFQVKFAEALEQPPAERIEALGKLSSEAPGAEAVPIALGLAYEKADGWQQAIEQYRKALEINATNYNAHFHLGLALLHEKQTADGLAELKKALELNPSDETVKRALSSMRASL